MGVQFTEMVDTLQQSRRAVRAELARLEATEDHDQLALLRLGEAVRSFADQSEVVLRIMVERDPSSALLEVVEELVAYFREAERQADKLLGVSQA